MRARVATVCLYLAGMVPGAVHADEVFLANGDRLTGTVVRKEGEELVFKTDYAGEVKIAWAKVVRLVADQPMSLVLSDQSLAEARTLVGPPKSPTPEAPSAEPKTEATEATGAKPDTPAQAKPEPDAVQVDQVAYINAGPGLDLLGIRWKGRLSVGGSGNRGNNDNDNLHIDGEAVARQQRNRYTINGVLDRSKDRDVVTRDASRLSGKYDLFINRGWYGYALLTLEQDRFRDIDRRTTIGAGIGHQLIENERTNLSIEGGLNYVRTDFDLAPDEDYPAARWALKYEQRLFGTDLQAFHSHELLSDLTDTNRTFIRSQTGVRLPLMQRLLATAQLNVDYDNAPAPGKVKSDRTYLFTLGYHW